jgi:SNF2 family DNA or RNA helicase
MVHKLGMSDAEIKSEWRETKLRVQREKQRRRALLAATKQRIEDEKLFKDEFADSKEDFKMDSDADEFGSVNGDEIKTVTVGDEKILDEDVVADQLGLKELFPNKWISSTKIDMCMARVQKIQDEFPGEKIIIFSQFTSFLDLLEVPLLSHGVEYLRYDGSMSSGDRTTTVRDFFGRPGVRVLLISLRAGNVGLTLTCASHVIIMDPFWNPFVEDQAMDRAHRIGQSRPVFVHRLLVKDTVEDRIMELQRKKKEVISAALDETGLKNISKLSRGELLFLFGLNERGDQLQARPSSNAD